MVRGCPTPVQGQIYEKLKGKTIMKHGIGRKLLSVVLAVMMLVSLLPTTAFAADQASGVTETTATEDVGSADPKKGSEDGSEDTNVENGGDDVGNNNNSSVDEADEGKNEVAPQAVAETDVARIGDVGYATLKEAIAATKSGDTVTLLQNVDLGSSSIGFYNGENTDLTFDLAGHTITTKTTSPSGYAVAVARAGLVIKNGTIENTSVRTNLKSCAVYVTNAGTTTFENVKMTAEGSGIYVSVNSGEAVINVENDTEISGKYGVYLSGTANKSSYDGAETLNVAGGKITGTTAGVYVKGPSTGSAAGAATTVNISGGEVGSITTVSGNSERPADVKITGGTVTGNLKNVGADVITISNGTVNGDVTNCGTLTITGGTFNGTITNTVNSTTTGTISVTGGTFTIADVTEYVPEGYEYDRSTGTVKEAEPTGVAKIGNTGYETLPAAVKAAKAGDTIVLLDNITLSSAQTISKQLTIDLNGKTITGTAYQTIQLKAGADLTVKDSASGGKITNTYTGSANPATIYLNAAGTKFTLESGTIESDPNKTTLQSVAINSEKYKACEVNIRGGSVTVPEAATNGRAIVASTNSMTLNISDGTITGGLHGVDAYSGSNVTITGGTISARIVDTGVIKEAYGMRITGTANVTVDGGEITGVKMDDDGYKLNVPNVTLKSGKINGSFYSITKGTIMFTVDDNATITFGNDTAKNFLPNTVKLVQNEDGSYGVKAAAAKVAQIGTVTYETLAEAIAAAKDGDTVTLLQDCSGDGIAVPAGKFTQGLTVDFATHSYTVGGKLVGSTGTASNGFQLLKDNKITFKNGAIYGDASVAGDDKTNWTGAPAILIQNYCDLTLENMIVTGGDETVYTMSNNNGDVVIENSTINAGKAKGYSYGPYAFDVCGYSSYTGVSVTVKGNSTINGNIEVSRSSSNKNDVKLALDGGTVNGELKIDSSIKSGDATTVTKSANVTLAAPDGYLWNADGKLVVAVAKVGDKSYESLQAAIDAASRNATVTMLADTRENVTISTPYLTLDLNGHTLNGSTGERKPALTVTARVTVKDSSDPSTGTIMREDTADNSGVSSHYVIDIQGAGWLTFEGGTVTNNSGNAAGKGASLVRVGDDSVEKYPGLNIKGGTFTQDNFIVIKVDSGDLFLNGGTLNSAHSYAIEDWHRATIKGGTVNGTVAAWTYSGGHNSDLTISGGTVNGNVASVSYDKTEGKLAKVSITGGTVTGTLGTYTYNNGLDPIENTSMATIEVTGGTFDKDPTKYVVEGSTVTKNSEGKFGVEKAYLAKVGNTSYYTMDEAFKAQTASGEPIVLLRDYTTGSTFNSGTVARVVDLGGHTWTCTGTDANSAAFEINNPNASLTVKNGKIVSSQLVGLIPSAMGGTITYDNSSLVFDGVEMTTTASSGIETNGNNTNDAVTLKNSTLNVPNGFGIYFPSSGTLTIDNSQITAKTMGVQVCAGSLSINDGSAITVSGDPVVKAENDGAIQDGAAISIVNRTGYKGLDKIEVTGGKFKSNGTNAAIKAYDWANNTESTFTANDKVAVSGGTFSSAVKEEYCATGYIPTANADGTYGVKAGAYVAQIEKGAKYETLQEAINAAGFDKKVYLLTDLTVSDTVEIPAGKNITLYLNNHTLTVENGHALRNYGKLYIQRGKVVSKTGAAVALGGDGVAKLYTYASTELEGREGAIITGEATGAVIDIRGGTYTATDNAVIAGNGSKRDGNPNKITITKGTFNGSITSTGYIACGIYAPWNDNVIVSGGTFNITDGAGIVARAGTVKVTGGTFICGDGQTTGWVGDSKNMVPCAALVFDKAANYPALTTDSKILVSGGSFSTDPSLNGTTLAAGYEAKQNEAGMYTLVSVDPVATVNGVNYGTLDKAIAAAEAAAEKGNEYHVILVKDIDDANTNYTVKGKVTIDLNGHDITGSGSNGVFYVTTKGDLTITGNGTITAVESSKSAMAVYVWSTAAKVTLAGGTYRQRTTSASDHFDLIYVGLGTVEVTGGKYEGATPKWTLNCEDKNYQNGADIIVTGGTFKSFDPSANPEGEGTTYVKDGYISVKNADGSYVVREGVYVAEVGDVKYESLADAIAAAESGQTVTLLADITIDGVKGLSAKAATNVTLDLNGHKIDGTSVSLTSTSKAALTLTVGYDKATGLGGMKITSSKDGAAIIGQLPLQLGGSGYADAIKVEIDDSVKLEVLEGGTNAVFMSGSRVYLPATDTTKAYYKNGGFMVTVDSEGRIYETLGGARNADPNVTLLNDYTTTSPLKIWGDWGDFTLDLGGYTYTSTTSDYSMIELQDNAKATFKNGTLKAEKAKTVIGSPYDNTTLVLDNVTVDAGGDYGIATNGSNTGINITLTDSTIKAPNGVGVYFPSTGSLTIDGENGSIEANTGVQVCAGNLIIKGGSITATGAGTTDYSSGSILDGAAISVIKRSGYAGTPTATIYDGTFKSADGIGAMQVYAVSGTEKSPWTDDVAEKINVSGGIFSTAVKLAWCAEGFIPHDNGDGTYTVKSQYVAMIGETKYTTLSEALKDAAKTGGTVLLVADVDDEELVHVRAGVTLNLNGHSITKAALIIVTGQIIDTSDASARGIVSADDYVITPLNGYTPVYDKAKGGYSFFNLWVRSAWESENNKGIFALGRNRSAQDAIECAAAKELLRADLSRVDAVITFSWEDQGTVVTQEFTFQNDKMLGYLGLTNGVLTVVVNGLDQLTGSVKMRAKFVFYKADGAELFTLYGDPVTVK